MKAPLNKVGLFVSYLHGGGAQRVISTLSFGLSKYYKVHIIVLDGKLISYPYQGELYDLETPASHTWLKKIPNFFKRIKKVKRFKQQHDLNAVISFLENANIINLLSGRNVKTIISVRNYKSKQTKRFIGKIYAFLMRMLYNKCDYLVAPSKGIKADLCENFGVRGSLIKVIYNPYDLEYIRKYSKEELPQKYRDFFNHSPLIITVGSMGKQKGHWHLIRAFQEVKDKLPEARLVILGEGKLRPYLEELTCKLNMKGSVLMPGFQDNPFRFINKADIFILPSLYEGFPNVLVEAMACGLPVIAADCPSGPREILAPDSDYTYQANEIEQAEYGILVPVGERKLKEAEEELSPKELAIAQAVTNLWANEDLKGHYRAKSLERAEHFKLDKILEQWVKLIES